MSRHSSQSEGGSSVKLSLLGLGLIQFILRADRKKVQPNPHFVQLMARFFRAKLLKFHDPKSFVEPSKDKNHAQRNPD
ncbi:MAG: hypothetical protein PHV34_00590 [Verrucomicrobiae bacterium]|nr:hypothetical protein [Verrucomicrobiae bacterium]